MKSCTRREGEAQAKLVSNYIFSNQIGCRYGNVMIIQILCIQFPKNKSLVICKSMYVKNDIVML